MKKVVIRESQYKAILEHMLKNNTPEPLMINEGSKELVLGAAAIITMAIGKDMSNYNKVIANRSISNPKIMSQIKAAFEDETRLKELTDKFEEVGMRDPSGLLSKNAHAIIDEFNKISKSKEMEYQLDVDAINLLKDLKPVKKK